MQRGMQRLVVKCQRIEAIDIFKIEILLAQNVRKLPISATKQVSPFGDHVEPIVPSGILSGDWKHPKTSPFGIQSGISQSLLVSTLGENIYERWDPPSYTCQI